MSHAVPQETRVIEITDAGGPEVLVPATRPVSQPQAGEVLIKVIAAGVNRPDVLQRKGGYPPPPGASDIPGLEVAGEIVALGPDVASWQLGDIVCALVAGGGYAEYCVAPAVQCLPIPQGLSPVEAAGLPETFFTVWSNVFDRGGLRPGENFLVHGGTSGIGTTAIQLASALGARVFTTAGSAEKCAVCERLGAELAVNYREQNFLDAIRAATNGAGVHLILDMVGGDYIAKDIDLLQPDGRLIFIAFLGGSRAEINFQKVMIKRLTITGSTLRIRNITFKAAIAAKLQTKVWPLLESGRIKPLIHRTFPLDDASEAHRLMESSTHIGKIVLTV
jgi:putative PIG3 family NAD(P)H quinone oxidoreductase